MGPDKKKLDALAAKMKALGILKQDLEEKFIKASGRGGQKVNKASSAVFIRHIPTGLSVKCGKHRSRHLNRFLALRSLVEAVEEKQLGPNKKQAAKLDRIRKQKDRRRRKARKKLSNARSAQPPESTNG